jgi:hypothetical protein
MKYKIQLLLKSESIWQWYIQINFENVQNKAPRQNILNVWVWYKNISQNKQFFLLVNRVNATSQKKILFLLTQDYINVRLKRQDEEMVKKFFWSDFIILHDFATLTSVKKCSIIGWRMRQYFGENILLSNSCEW